MPESAATPPSPLRAAAPDTPPSPTAFGNGAEPTSLAQEVQQLRAQLAEAQARADNLEIALHTSRLIGAAAGIVMSQYRLTIDAAVDVLRAISQHTNRKVRDIAEDVIYTGVLELGPSTPSAHTPDQPQRPHLRLVPESILRGYARVRQHQLLPPRSHGSQRKRRHLAADEPIAAPFIV